MMKFLPGIAAASLIATSAMAQTTTTPTMPAPPPTTIEKSPAPTTTPAMPTPSMTPSPATSGSLTLTDDQAKAWVSKVVYSSDNKNLGEVAAFARDASGKVTEMHADIGGFLGLGESRIRLMPNQFKLDTDRVVLNITAEQAKALPHIAKK